MLKIFVLNIENLIGLKPGNEFYDKIFSVIDSDRKTKISHFSKNQTGIADCLGAGLLLAYSVCLYRNNRLWDDEILTTAFADVMLKTLDDYGMIEQLKYKTGSEGKPYFIDESLPFFNISHSGKLVVLALSDKEVGADIQIKKAKKELDMAKRFFAEDEYALIQSDGTSGFTQFYRLWAKKEALGKCTGEGVRPYLDKCMIDFPKGYDYFEKEIEVGEDYYILFACTKIKV